MKSLLFSRSILKISLLALVAFTAETRTSAAGVITIATSDSEYTAGDIFDFSLVMPSLTGLAAYEISLHLTSNSGTAGVDYHFLDANPASTDYLFASSSNFAGTAVVDSPSRYRMTISDIDDTLGTDVITGVNDQIASIRILTSSTYKGELELSIDTDGLFLDRLDLSEFSLSPVAEYGSVVADTAATGTTRISAASPPSVVPEPSTATFALMGIACFVLAVRRGGL